MNGGRVKCRWCSDSHVVLNAGEATPCVFCDPAGYRRTLGLTRADVRRSKRRQVRAKERAALRRENEAMDKPPFYRVVSMPWGPGNR